MIAAKIVSISPNGFILKTKFPLKTTKATPNKAIIDPINVFLRIGVLSIRKDNRMVNIGAVEISSDTFDAMVISNAVFSAIKYKEPPLNPHKNSRNSSL